MPDEPFDIVRDIKKAIKTLEEKRVPPQYYMYLTQKQRDIWKKALKNTIAWTEKDGKDYVFGVEVKLYEDLIQERKREIENIDCNSLFGHGAGGLHDEPDQSSERF